VEVRWLLSRESKGTLKIQRKSHCSWIASFGGVGADHLGPEIGMVGPLRGFPDWLAIVRAPSTHASNR
jgi:hypothetical protein